MAQFCVFKCTNHKSDAVRVSAAKQFADPVFGSQFWLGTSLMSRACTERVFHYTNSWRYLVEASPFYVPQCGRPVDERGRELELQTCSHQEVGYCHSSLLPSQQGKSLGLGLKNIPVPGRQALGYSWQLAEWRYLVRGLVQTRPLWVSTGLNGW